MRKYYWAIGFIFIAIILILAVVKSQQANYLDPTGSLELTEAKMKVYYSPHPEDYNGIVPDPSKNRIVKYYIKIKNNGPKSKEFVITQVLVDQELSKLIVFDQTISDPMEDLTPNHAVMVGPYPSVAVEGDPAKIEELAHKKIEVKIVWAEGNKKFSKAFSVTPEDSHV